MLTKNSEIRIAVFGLGYVGMPLACAFSEKFDTIGFDIDKKRVDELQQGKDSHKIFGVNTFKKPEKLSLSNSTNELSDCNVYIITVPTPIDGDNAPDLSPLGSACELLGGIIKSDDTIIFESTVFPGCTETFCVPLLEKSSGLRYNKDFYCGYSPERINPGDSKQTLKNIVKLTSGSNEVTRKFVDLLYREIIDVGTFSVSEIKIAEASKVLENIQRDVNIALINEVGHLFSQIGIDTEKVLQAARTKWNFLDFRPGLVGGHCIGVDPYYLIHSATENDVELKIIKQARLTNELTIARTAQDIAHLATGSPNDRQSKNVLLLGAAFKENCGDVRNSGSLKIAKILKDQGFIIDIFDPIVEWESMNVPEYVNSIISDLQITAEYKYAASAILVAHDCFRQKSSEIAFFLAQSGGNVLDLKKIL